MSHWKTCQSLNFTLLGNAHNDEIADAIVDAFIGVEHNFALEKWKASGLDAGHFVEAVRRAVELQLFGTYTPFSDKLDAFHNGVLDKHDDVSPKSCTTR